MHDFPKKTSIRKAIKEFGNYVNQKHDKLWNLLDNFLKNFIHLLPILNLAEHDETELSKTCVYFYTMESFLVYQMNQPLREDDKTKLDLIGSYIQQLMKVNLQEFT